MSYYGKLTGKTYESLEAMRHYEGLEAQRRNVPTAEESAFDNLPADKVRELIVKAAKSEEQKASELQRGVDVLAFKQAYPEYADSVPNSAAMILYLKGMGINDLATANFHQLEYAFLHLKESGFLKLKASAVSRQQSQAVNDRLREIEKSRPEFNESDAYNTLSMDEVRQRAAQQLSGVQVVRDGGVGSMGAEFGETTAPLNSAAVPHALDDPQRHVTPGSSLNHRGWR